MKTIVGLFHDFDLARRVIDDLIDEGIPRQRISLVASDTERKYGRGLRDVKDLHRDNDDNGRLRQDEHHHTTGEDAAKGAGAGAILGAIAGAIAAAAIPGIGPVIVAGEVATVLAGAGIGAGVGAAIGGLVGALVHVGVPEREAKLYAEGVRRGGALVVVRAPEELVGRVTRIMERHHPIDIDESSRRWREKGWTGYNAKAEPLSTREIELERDFHRSCISKTGLGTGTARPTENLQSNLKPNLKDEETLEVVDENVRVGKRAVETGGVRIRTYTTEVPVEEKVRLRDEHIEVERRKVDRPLRPGEASGAFKEGTIELRERHEEPVVSKEARVTEEIRLRKGVEEHVETVRDTERHTEVDVEGLKGPRFEHLNEDFQRHFATHVKTNGQRFEQCKPAYRLGYSLAADRRYRDRSWREMEPVARRNWEKESHSNTWDEIKGAVSHAWHRTRERF